MNKKLAHLLLCYRCQNMTPVHLVSRLDAARPHQIHRRKKHFYNEIVVRLQVGFECLALLSSYDKYMCQSVGVGVVVERRKAQATTTKQQQQQRQKETPSNETCLIDGVGVMGLKSCLFRSFILRSVTAKVTAVTVQNPKTHRHIAIGNLHLHLYHHTILFAPSPWRDMPMLPSQW